MKLRDYLTTKEVPVARFAERIGVHPQAVHRYMTGERTPRPKIMRRIVEVTGGEVTADSFLDTDLRGRAA